ncbi:DUF1842 domain-containing protein [Magnetospirillum aberrantis]|uniref:DUF1842 domain-containing protein n=1 Tax=Magnetospirillum aberrantis SpK TaxID=908842 RepID=A0A7C9QX29_9PROT|nr:DUF1842 domain-containing protein [Magnetospirillum aberrantis]NFV81356.1 DUF1842 domain-containing protein [Magnetospirillum aberrantis SpK]
MAVGTFLVSYESVNVLAGGYCLTLDLVVDVVNNKAAGMSGVTQATNPPLDVKLPVHGTVTDMTVMPKSTHHLVALQSSDKMLGRHIEVRLVTTDDWQSGTANVTLFLDTPDGLRQFTTEVKAVKAEQK